MTLSDRLGAALFPLATVAALLLLWRLAVDHWQISPHLLPAPEAVLLRLWEGLLSGEMGPHIGATALATLLGYAFGCGSAVALAILLGEWPVAERALYPLLLAFQAIPKVSIAPLIFIWAGFGLESQVILVAMICFFPVFTGTLIALRTIDGNLLDLYRSLSAGRLHILLDIKIPGAAHAIFTGLEVSVVFALIGCVVMEFITGTQGTGFLIQNSANMLDTPLAIATMLALAGLGVMGTQIVRILHIWVVFWDRPAGSVSPFAAGKGVRQG